ncbi:hypothetical protein [Pelagicoccus sp. SDUM812003]|uniref:hypothetical protein n=1 Tax=Pelagicoccus sp. SDUM812003 TaxID=3041267 RepID=UPI00280D40C2|nr:hypothetical protein [Pelagicoccus sp. SDUM812003]MDQ8205781.1 hypothetical protein [Pelagicoccus sp. SDUM812003]
MKKLFGKLTILVISSALLFYAGTLFGISKSYGTIRDLEVDGIFGEFNSDIITLILLESDQSDKAIKVCKEGIYMKIPMLHRMLQEENTEISAYYLKEMILSAKDLAEVAGFDPYVISKEDLEESEQFYGSTQNRTVTVNGKKVTENPFFAYKREAKEIFTMYEDQRSDLYEYIVYKINKQNQSSHTTPASAPR